MRPIIFEVETGLIDYYITGLNKLGVEHLLMIVPRPNVFEIRPSVEELIGEWEYRCSSPQVWGTSLGFTKSEEFKFIQRGFASYKSINLSDAKVLQFIRNHLELFLL